MPVWPFDDPPNFTAFSTRQVFESKQPILAVYHDLEDGAWQFHGPGEWQRGDLVVLCLEHALAYDPSVGELADLPRGWGRSDVASLRRSSAFPCLQTLSRWPRRPNPQLQPPGRRRWSSARARPAASGQWHEDLCGR